jgi:hypothetical protein
MTGSISAITESPPELNTHYKKAKAICLTISFSSGDKSKYSQCPEQDIIAVRDSSVSCFI